MNFALQQQYYYSINNSTTQERIPLLHPGPCAGEARGRAGGAVRAYERRACCRLTGTGGTAK